MAYCTGAEANNLKGRFQKKLAKIDVEGKEPFQGIRWLEPDDELITRGEIKIKPGRKPKPLFTVVGELLPRAAWSELPDTISGIYILFDAAETARYVGISNDIKWRLKRYFTETHREDEAKREVITAFSAYGVSSRQRARELESMLIHILGPQLFLNTQKHRYFGEKANYKVFEPGTLLLQRRTKFVGIQTMLRADQE